MKTIRNLCAVMALLIGLSISVIAGEISTNVVSPPPPPASATTTAPGHITTGALTEPTQNAVDSQPLMTEITLSLLQLLALI
jgi:hypothetical protein